MRTQRLPWVFRLQFLAFALLVPMLGYAQTSSVQPRITQAVDESQLTTLKGNTHPLAKAQYDQGAVADGQQMRRMLLLLQRSADQGRALRQFVDLQQSKASPSFHQWLTPQQFGQLYGPADADIEAVTSWLSSHGFQINRVSAGRTLIEFSGTAGLVRDAFHTEIHRYVVNGEEHFANATDPQIPTALVPVVAGPVSLNNFKKKRQSRNLGVYRKTKATGEVVSLAPQYTFSPCTPAVTGAGSNCNALGPGDFAAIYNLNSLYMQTPSLDGTGQTIAIVGDSEICTASSPDFSTCSSDDAATYRSQFGLSTANLPNVIVDGPDPGFNGDEIEGDLDTQLAGAVARNATIDFVIAEDTESTAGIDLAAEYIVDNNLAPVMSESFGECEAGLGTNGNEFYATLWEQAAAQGITVIVSTGDFGSAACDDPDTQQYAYQFGTAVNGIASTAFTVAAGGTDFDVTQANYQTTYWSGPNTQASGYVSATTYIPETTWNDSCAQSLTATVGGTLCNSTTTSSPSLNIVGGGGGQSNCAALDAEGYCTGYYAKPSWQTVASGSAGLTAANDITRDLPDISLFSADGFVSNSFYVVCESDLNPSGVACDIQAPYFDFIGVGGTSSAAPAFAGIMALVNQKLSAQGDANYVLYNLATNYAGTFNPVTKGNNSVPCAPGSINCSITNSNSTIFGVLEFQNLVTLAQTTDLAFTAGTGLDLATGLGSINAANLVANWTTAEGKFTPTTTTLCLSLAETTPANCTPGPITITHGGTVYVNIAVTPNPGPGTTVVEDAALIGTYPGGNTAGVDQFTSNNYVISNADIYPLTNGVFSGATAGTECPAGNNCNYTLSLVGGSYSVAAHYAGDGTFGSSYSTPGISVTVNPEGSAATQSVVLFNPVSEACVVSPSTSTAFAPICVGATVASEPYGSIFALRVDVVGTSSGQEKATGNVDFTGLPAGFASTYPLNSEGYAEVQSPGNYGALSGLPQIPALPPGSYNFTAQYCGTSTPPACTGDPSYNASAVTAPLAFTITQGLTEMTLTPSATAVAAGTQVTLTAFVDTVDAANYSGGSYGNAPSGTLQFMANGSPVGAPVALTATTDVNGYSAAMAMLVVTPSATTTYTATFTGDTNYTASGTGSATVTVTAGFTLSSSATTVTTTAGGTTASGSSMITLTPSGGFTGAVNVTCGTIAGVTCNALTLPSGTTSGTLTINVKDPSSSMTAMATPDTRNLWAGGTAPKNLGGRGWWTLSGGAGLAAVLLVFLPGKKRRRRMLALQLGVVCLAAFAAGCGGSSSSAPAPVAPVASTTQLTVSSTKVPASGGITVSATVTASGVTPTGNVQFMVDGAASGAPAALTNGTTGNVTLTAGVGTHTVSASYLGSSSVTASQSGTLNVTATGTTTLAITGTSGTTTANGTVSLTIQ